jgi:hypothetical protein
VRHGCGQFLLFFRVESGSAHHRPGDTCIRACSSSSRIHKRLSVFSFVALDLWSRVGP